MDEKGFKTIADVSGHSLHRVSEFKDLDLSYRAVARIDTEKCIKCNLCYVACNDTAHQCIDLVSPQGALVQPHAYDVRSNGSRRLKRGLSRRFAKRIAWAAVSAITYARWTIALKWLSFPQAAVELHGASSRKIRPKSPKTGRR